MTCTDVRPSSTARLTMMPAFSSRSSSENPEGLRSLASSASFSASAAAWRRAATDALAPSISAIFICRSLALGSFAMSSLRSHFSVARRPLSVFLLDEAPPFQAGVVVVLLALLAGRQLHLLPLDLLVGDPREDV